MCSSSKSQMIGRSIQVETHNLRRELMLGTVQKKILEQNMMTKITSTVAGPSTALFVLTLKRALRSMASRSWTLQVNWKPCTTNSWLKDATESLLAFANNPLKLMNTFLRFKFQHGKSNPKLTSERWVMTQLSKWWILFNPKLCRKM